MRVQGCGPSGVTGVEVRNVMEGFSCVDVMWGSRVNQCMSVNILCGGIEVKALIDTGCKVNVVYSEAFERMRMKDSERDTINGE